MPGYLLPQCPGIVCYIAKTRGGGSWDDAGMLLG